MSRATLDRVVNYLGLHSFRKKVQTCCAGGADRGQRLGFVSVDRSFGCSGHVQSLVSWQQFEGSFDS